MRYIYLEKLQSNQKEVATYKSSSSSDVTILRKELLITQLELEAIQKELMMLRSKSESKSRTEIDKLMIELDQWKRKYQELEQKDKDNAEQLKQLTYYQNKLKLFEFRSNKKKFEKYQTADLLQKQLNDQEQLIVELRLEIQRSKDKYDAYVLESQEIRIKVSQNDVLINELGQWKDRCKVLEASHQTSDDYQLSAMFIIQKNLKKQNKKNGNQRFKLNNQKKIVIN